MCCIPFISFSCSPSLRVFLSTRPTVYDLHFLPSTTDFVTLELLSSVLRRVRCASSSGVVNSAGCHVARLSISYSINSPLSSELLYHGWLKGVRCSAPCYTAHDSSASSITGCFSSKLAAMLFLSFRFWSQSHFLLRAPPPVAFARSLFLALSSFLHLDVRFFPRMIYR